jgi:integrase
MAQAAEEGSETEGARVSIFKIGKFYHYDFVLDGKRYKASTGHTNKEKAGDVERDLKKRLRSGFAEVVEEEARQRQRKTIEAVADECFKDYQAKHTANSFAEYALGHVKALLGTRLVAEITPDVVKRYQTDRLNQKAGPKTINDEVQFLLRLLPAAQADVIRGQLRRERALKLPTPPSPGRAFSADEKARLMDEARKLRSPHIYTALVLDLHTGLRDKELRELRWKQVDLVDKKTLVVGLSKTEAGTGRPIPLNEMAVAALTAHASWYIRKFGQCKPEWYIFPAGKPQPTDPTHPVSTLKTAWKKVRENAKVTGRWHDNRHTVVTELAESGAGEEVIMGIAGHVSRAMLSRYSHIGMEAKRRALDEIAARQREADRKRKEEADRREAERQQAAAQQQVPQTEAVQ